MDFDNLLNTGSLLSDVDSWTSSWMDSLSTQLDDVMNSITTDYYNSLSQIVDDYITGMTQTASAAASSVQSGIQASIPTSTPSSISTGATQLTSGVTAWQSATSTALSDYQNYLNGLLNNIPGASVTTRPSSNTVGTSGRNYTIASGQTTRPSYTITPSASSARKSSSNPATYTKPSTTTPNTTTTRSTGQVVQARPSTTTTTTGGSKKADDMISDIEKAYTQAIDSIFNDLTNSVNKILAGNALGNNTLQNTIPTTKNTSSSLLGNLNLNNGLNNQNTGASPNNNTGTTGGTSNTYIITLDLQGGTGGSLTVTATYGSPIPTISVPVRPGYVFGGYYSLTNGTGTKYINPDGTSAHNWDQMSNMTLYAYWMVSSFGTIPTGGGSQGGSGTNPVQTPQQYAGYGPRTYAGRDYREDMKKAEQQKQQKQQEAVENNKNGGSTTHTSKSGNTHGGSGGTFGTPPTPDIPSYYSQKPNGNTDPTKVTVLDKYGDDVTTDVDGLSMALQTGAITKEEYAKGLVELRNNGAITTDEFANKMKQYDEQAIKDKQSQKNTTTTSTPEPIIPTNGRKYTGTGQKAQNPEKKQNGNTDPTKVTVLDKYGDDVTTDADGLSMALQTGAITKEEYAKGLVELRNNGTITTDEFANRMKEYDVQAAKDKQSQQSTTPSQVPNPEPTPKPEEGTKSTKELIQQKVDKYLEMAEWQHKNGMLTDKQYEEQVDLIKQMGEEQLKKYGLGETEAQPQKTLAEERFEQIKAQGGILPKSEKTNGEQQTGAKTAESTTSALEKAKEAASNAFSKIKSLLGGNTGSTSSTQSTSSTGGSKTSGGKSGGLGGKPMASQKSSNTSSTSSTSTKPKGNGGR